MTILNMVGLISLISLVIYFVLYFIKPNYQQKYVSSTFIWKLSLKYKKKRIPINKLRNILLVICQILLLILLTMIIMKPVVIAKQTNENEVILIVDASASMRTTDDYDTRFDRAVDLAKRKATEVLNNDGIVSIVISTNDPYFLVERETKENINQVMIELENLIEDYECTYGKTDLNKSINLCNDILIENSSASIFIYSDVTADYIDKGITLVNVREAVEYNIAITNAYSEVYENYYMFTVEVVSYGKDEEIDLSIEISGANASEDNPTGLIYPFTHNVYLTNDEAKKIVFINSNVNLENFDNSSNVEYYLIPDTDKILSYETVHVSINATDSFIYDNSFDIYGGTKEVIKVLYASSSSNAFFNSAILVLQSAFSNKYTISYTRYKEKNDIPNSGYDLYIYEHESMPASAPSDGVVIYSDPLVDTIGSGFRVQGSLDYNKVSMPLTEEKEHPITKGIVADNITISRVVRLLGQPQDYDTLMTCDGRPAIMICDNDDVKNIVLLYSLNYSNMPIEKGILPRFLYNIFNYFLPQTVDGHSFEIDDSVEVRSRGNDVEITGNGKTVTIDTFPGTYSFTIPGTYDVSQTSIFGKEIKDQIFVRIPAEESNILLNVDSITSPVAQQSLESIYNDLLLWLSITLASLLFIEWLLKGKDTL